MPEIPFEYTSPVDGYDSSGFGYRVHPIQEPSSFTTARTSPRTTATASSLSRTVMSMRRGESDSYGKYLILTHEGGFASLYAHLSEFVAHEGIWLSAARR